MVKAIKSARTEVDIHCVDCAEVFAIEIAAKKHTFDTGHETRMRTTQVTIFVK